MKNIWSVLCEEVNVNKQNNKVSLFNCIEGLEISFPDDKKVNNELKNIPMSFDIASLWIKDVEEIGNFKLLISFCDPSGKELKKFEKEFSFKESARRLRTFIRVSGFPVNSEGTYSVKLSYKQNGKFKLVSSLPFDVVFAKNDLIK